MSAIAYSTIWEWAATGSTWRIFHSGGVDSQLARAAAAAVERDEARWSRFRPESEVSHINAAGGRPTQVSAATIDLLQTSVDWSERTGGLFQPLVGRAMVAWGYRRSLRTSPAFAAASPGARRLDGRLDIDSWARTVRITPGSRLDLGGIGKSWIAVRVAMLLTARCDDPLLLVDAGGDLVAARGEHVVSVEAPGDTVPRPPAAQIRLREGQGVATSGYGRRQWTNGDGRRAHHLIDPTTGTPGRLAHATVVSDDPVAADVLAKVLVLRPDRIRTIAEPAIVTTDGRSAVSRRWREVVAK
jgi:FAD:protein FMN transferase